MDDFEESTVEERRKFSVFVSDEYIMNQANLKFDDRFSKKIIKYKNCKVLHIKRID